MKEIKIGTVYEDPEGQWEVVGFDGENAMIKLIDGTSKADFHDHVMIVEIKEVLYFLSHNWNTDEEI